MAQSWSWSGRNDTAAEMFVRHANCGVERCHSFCVGTLNCRLLFVSWKYAWLSVVPGLFISSCCFGHACPLSLWVGGSDSLHWVIPLSSRISTFPTAKRKLQTRPKACNNVRNYTSSAQPLEAQQCEKNFRFWWKYYNMWGYYEIFNDCYRRQRGNVLPGSVCLVFLSVHDQHYAKINGQILM